MSKVLRAFFVVVCLVVILGTGLHGCGSGSLSASGMCASFLSKLNRQCLDPALSSQELRQLTAEKCPSTLNKINCKIKDYYSCAFDAIPGLPCGASEAQTAIAEKCANPCPELFTIDADNRLLCPADMSLSFEDIAVAAPKVENTPDNDPTLEPEPTATEEPGAAPTEEPLPPAATPTVVAQEPGLALDTEQLSFDHLVSETSCPQDIGSFNVINDGTGTGTYTVGTNTGALSSDVSQFVLQPGGSQEVNAFFTCSQTTSFNGLITVTASGGSDELTLDVNVDGTISFR